MPGRVENDKLLQLVMITASSPRIFHLSASRLCMYLSRRDDVQPTVAANLLTQVACFDNSSSLVQWDCDDDDDDDVDGGGSRTTNNETDGASGSAHRAQARTHAAVA